MPTALGFLTSWWTILMICRDTDHLTCLANKGVSNSMVKMAKKPNEL